MTQKDKENVLHCLKVMIDEEVCEECNLYGTTGTDHCEKDCVRMAIEALQTEQKWIPVSERLPEKQDCYLVTTKWKGSYSGDVYIETNMAVYREKPKEWDCADVIAWMPLPEPFKAESEGE